MRELYKFLYWTKTSPSAHDRLAQEGYAPWIESLNNHIIQNLLNATCEGNQILSIIDEDSHNTSSYNFFLSLGMILLGSHSNFQLSTDRA
jgi:hypothetical protein